MELEQVVGFEPTRAYADGLQDRSNQPLWDTCILGIKLIPILHQNIFLYLLLFLVNYIYRTIYELRYQILGIALQF